VFADMEEITVVPLLPQPIIPTRIAELAFEPKTIPGFKIVMAESVAVVLRNDLLSIVFVMMVVCIIYTNRIVFIYRMLLLCFYCDSGALLYWMTAIQQHIFSPVMH